MTSTRLAILDDYQNVAKGFAPWQSLEARSVEITTFNRPFGSPEETVAALTGFDAVIAMRERTPFPREVLQKLEKLQLLVTTGMANAAIDLDAAREKNIVVCGTSGSPTAAPEHTWALLLAFARDIPAQESALRSGQWQTSVGFELAGKTLGILGLGKIGHRIAGYGRAFGMDVIAWSPNLREDTASAAGARRVTKQQLFAESDIVTLHARLSERSKGVVGEKELRLLGPDGVLINTARGALVDQNALVDALKYRWIRGAALDVYDIEPLPANHPLLSAPNTVLSPHLGYVTTESYTRFYREALEDVVAWLDGLPLRTLAG
ncbi:D-2-hydroxyacid dehydrogenase family protein [Paenarthrobacter sp. DKR-5]|uniref:D-2-hydroxyacid dehydrogenase family protein n=1 Tax=Paenarthrobacter sp. DKR-5 TaxID=2835535 RepID=UPI001BDCCDA3|nr:D-2-hydroxyacid dehydrogenase family protein [Paenarthrobacter sp. DKR-5]MBT1003943.1 D-2-hydroxyacid dehydrogenase family protein [Paenarthrobacter sp. DKR-5]